MWGIKTCFNEEWKECGGQAFKDLCPGCDSWQVHLCGDFGQNDSDFSRLLLNDKKLNGYL